MSVVGRSLAPFVDKLGGSCGEIETQDHVNTTEQLPWTGPLDYFTKNGDSFKIFSPPQNYDPSLSYPHLD